MIVHMVKGLWGVSPTRMPPLQEYGFFESPIRISRSN